MSKLNLMDSTYEILTTRQYAAIHLRVADSGDAELDAMIRQANRMRLTEVAMQGILAWSESERSGMELSTMLKMSVVAADGLLAALEAKP